MMCKSPDVPVQDVCVDHSQYIVICGQLELQVLKIDWFSVGWFMLAVRLVSSSGLLHIMGSNAKIFAVLCNL